MKMSLRSSVDFFDSQFKQQVIRSELALNPFEVASLPFVSGSLLDFGCGLGNLALSAARRGSQVLAVDASATAIDHLRTVARNEALPVRAERADLRHYTTAESFDSVVSIGLLMFFDCATAFRQLDLLKSLVNPGGVAAINVLTQGTTFMDMFSAEGHCLFEQGELSRQFEGWEILLDERRIFPAPLDTVKKFDTLVARKRL